MTSTDGDADGQSLFPDRGGEAGDEASPPRFASARAKTSEGAHPFFMELEDILIRLRTRALTVSPADWQLAKKWYLAGIPIALIERTLEELFVQRIQAGKEGISSLRLARRKVERAWDELRKLQAPAAGRPTDDQDDPGEAEVGLAERLDRLAERLPEGLATRDEWMAEIRALAALEDLAAVEKALAEVEARLLEAVETDLDDGARHALDERLAAALEPLEDRLRADQRISAQRRLRQRFLRQDFALPTLSLFTD